MRKLNWDDPDVSIVYIAYVYQTNVIKSGFGGSGKTIVFCTFPKGLYNACITTLIQIEFSFDMQSTCM